MLEGGDAAPRRGGSAPRPGELGLESQAAARVDLGDQRVGWAGGAASVLSGIQPHPTARLTNGDHVVRRSAGESNLCAPAFGLMPQRPQALARFTIGD
eukprot:CAMPEP_0179362928 /NCGR_PEP_ID=MMETSP0797-20121207/81263_1 /TAXON_ID=47934 /ORGANISM="Dinophysis acuminata, Strain DAEP01" /LENGTH=97 /DNA_ID=CAMNT_0021078365 /DNA_START=137 /DNA_END=427 /DNA_ORIENTATION=+